ncbi:MAG: hypothetical protein RBT71_11565 [Flavobacteriales bacterium]|jgi:hypothetical protein|nr:hypothetical protein [Flavobacteriales bacterium]
MSIDHEVPAKAHELEFRRPQRWKNYYSGVNPVQDKPELGTLTQD